MNKKFKIFLLISSYSFFLFILIIAFNAVIPENNLVVIEANKPLIKKIENKFENDKDSIYEILKEKNNSTDKKIEKTLKYKKEELISKIESLEKINNSSVTKNYKIQFMSFKNLDKSNSESKTLQNRLKEDNFNYNLIVKKAKINGEVYYRIITSEIFSLNQSKSICKQLKIKQYKCIVIKS